MPNSTLRAQFNTFETHVVQRRDSGKVSLDEVKKHMQEHETSMMDVKGDPTPVLRSRRLSFQRK